MNKCRNCETETSNPKYCSRSCAASVNGALYPKRKAAPPKTRCKQCGKEAKSWQATYCSESCRHLWHAERNAERWAAGDVSSAVGTDGLLCAWARRWLVRQADYQCSACGWNAVNPRTGKSPVQVDHIDGDAYNNQLSNLRVLCPNCHSLTPTYGAGNKPTVRAALGLPVLKPRPERVRYATDGTRKVKSS